ncbi:hypothetical protein NAP1_14768 [Erythrobacter sp. NAP1]|uniref:flagella basal body P-ring formation protein FlgA n=1 Tax=Erythrobacter sp. NAP1 TaxID=237727 RepID=UPI0000687648|nr:flagella basal body P-ring formation protein FlgA [Erythrobacter sp. NAP1]EAQ28871.1 hypothetical protein NAP1_14768 [Erythrobacter sp. NAP1]
MKLTAPARYPRVKGALIAVGLSGMLAAAAPVGAQNATQGPHMDPAAIDRAIVEFTGLPIGQEGSARMPADRRLRLAACAAPLGISWHGRARTTLAVSCAGPQPWRIFIAAHTANVPDKAEPVVTRGDPLTIAVRGRGFTVQQAGEAMENGSPGDWIAVRTSRDAQPVRARIERPGLAIIPAP